jgi:hypothetical protein
MCATSVSDSIPLYNEGKQYCQDLTDECKRYVDCVNATLVQNGTEPDGLLRSEAAPESLHLIRN